MKKSNKNIDIKLVIFGLLFSIVPFFINRSSIFRIISLLLGVCLITYALVRKNLKEKVRLILCFLCIAICFAVFDFFLVFTFKRVPVVSYKIESSSKVASYNSFFYRLIRCDKKYYTDFGYKKSYMCKKDDIKLVSINEFLENPEESYKEYKYKYVHLSGKINTIVGTSSLILNAYTSEDSLNGFVSFDEGRKIVLDNLQIDPKNYYIYDIVEVIGKVSSYMEKDTIKEIHLTDAKVINSDIYDNYELVVNNIDEKKKTLAHGNIYYYGLQGIYYKYDESNIYTLDYLLSDKREVIDDLIKGIEAEVVNDEDKLYKLDKYSLLVCKNEDVVFLNKKIKNFEDICE